MAANLKELAHEFPERADRIHLLMVWDPLFRRLFDEFNEANSEIASAEALEIRLCETAEASLRRKRMSLKAELAGMIDGVRLTK